MTSQLARLDRPEGQSEGRPPVSHRVRARMCAIIASHSSPGTHRIRISRRPTHSCRELKLIIPALISSCLRVLHICHPTTPSIHPSLCPGSGKISLISRHTYSASQRNKNVYSEPTCSARDLLRLPSRPTSRTRTRTPKPHIQDGSNGPETTRRPLRLAGDEPSTELQYVLFPYFSLCPPHTPEAR